MIEILLLLLKIIGIVLLSLLILFLFLVGAVLFIPVCYQIKAKKDNAIYAESKISWCFHLISISLRYEKEVFIKIRILGITIYDNTKPRKVKKKKEKRKKEKELPILEEITQDATKEMPKEIPQKPQVAQKTDAPKETTKKAEAIENKMSFFDKIKQFMEKSKHVFENIRYYIEICQKEEMKLAFRLCKKSLLKILNWIKPKKFQMYLHIGTNDPATTGQILVWYSMLYPFIGKNIAIEPEFEMFILEGNLYAKGRIRFIVFVCIAWKIFFDKNIRTVISLFRKEE